MPVGITETPPSEVVLLAREIFWRGHEPHARFGGMVRADSGAGSRGHKRTTGVAPDEHCREHCEGLLESVPNWSQNPGSAAANPSVSRAHSRSTHRLTREPLRGREATFPYNELTLSQLRGRGWARGTIPCLLSAHVSSLSPPLHELLDLQMDMFESFS